MHYSVISEDFVTSKSYILLNKIEKLYFTLSDRNWTVPFKHSLMDPLRDFLTQQKLSIQQWAALVWSVLCNFTEFLRELFLYWIYWLCKIFWWNAGLIIAEPNSIASRAVWQQSSVFFRRVNNVDDTMLSDPRHMWWNSSLSGWRRIWVFLLYQASACSTALLFESHLIFMIVIKICYNTNTISKYLHPIAIDGIYINWLYYPFN